MAFGSFQSSGGGGNQAMSEINMVPLIDIVLVLLVLFILAAPMAAQSVLISLPKTQTMAPQEPIDAMNFSLREDGALLSEDGELLDEATFANLLLETAKLENVPVIRIWSDQDVRYSYLADVIVKVKNAGLNKVSLMSRTGG